MVGASRLVVERLPPLRMLPRVAGRVQPIKFNMSATLIDFFIHRQHFRKTSRRIRACSSSASRLDLSLSTRPEQIELTLLPGVSWHRLHARTGGSTMQSTRLRPQWQLIPQALTGTVTTVHRSLRRMKKTRSAITHRH